MKTKISIALMDTIHHQFELSMELQSRIENKSGFAKSELLTEKLSVDNKNKKRDHLLQIFSGQ